MENRICTNAGCLQSAEIVITNSLTILIFSTLQQLYNVPRFIASVKLYIKDDSVSSKTSGEVALIREISGLSKKKRSSFRMLKSAILVICIVAISAVPFEHQPDSEPHLSFCTR